MCPRVLSHVSFTVSVCVYGTDVWSRSSFRVTTFTFLSADVSKTIDLVAYWRLTFTDCNPTHFCCQFQLHSLYSWWFWWFSQLFQWILRFKWSIWSGWARVRKETTTVCFVTLYWRSSIWKYNESGAGKIVQHSCFIQTEKKQSGSYPVVSTHSLGPVHLRWGHGGALLACDTYGFWCDWAFMVLLADQHWKRSCLAGASTCFWTHCTEYLQQVTQSAQFQLVLGTSNFIFHRY